MYLHICYQCLAQLGGQLLNTERHNSKVYFFARILLHIRYRRRNKESHIRRVYPRKLCVWPPSNT
ncbi:hypothetical protein N7490_003214 [Penicillium lividum]|nr:hypothetical protein N7490_003214 [Penicillium lividum]